MGFVGEIIIEIVILSVAGILFSWIFWRLTRNKMSFGDFLAKYGEVLAYVGVALVTILVIYSSN